jgi:hypothetical protein
MAMNQLDPPASKAPHPERAPAEDLDTSAPLPQVNERMLAPQQILQLQRTMGNRAVSGALGRAATQRPAAAPILQRRLVPIDTFKRDKAAATTTKMFGRVRSTKDVETIYTAYAAAIAGPAPNWTLADKQLDLLEAKLAKMAAKTYWKTGAAAPFLAAQRAGLVQERIWLDEQRYGRLAANPTALAADARPVIKLYMEQGVAAPLNRVQLHSAQFSTCSPVVLFNAASGVGGLFHFGAKALEDQRSAMRQICALVNPTQVTILLGGGDMDFRDTPFTEDQEPLRAFFQAMCPAAAVAVSDEMYGSITITLGEGGGVSMAKGAPPEAHNTGKDADDVPAGAQLVGNRAVDMSIWT